MSIEEPFAGSSYKTATQPPPGNRPHDQHGKAPATFGGIDKSAVRPRPSGAPDFVAIQHTEEFEQLRSRIRRFVFPMSLLFLCWYLSYVLLAAYAHDFMAYRLFGEINVGIVLGVLQFVTTVAITAGYVRFAERRVDPTVDRIREQAGQDMGGVQR